MSEELGWAGLGWSRKKPPSVTLEIPGSLDIRIPICTRGFLSDSTSPRRVIPMGLGVGICRALWLKQTQGRGPLLRSPQLTLGQPTVACSSTSLTWTVPHCPQVPSAPAPASSLQRGQTSPPHKQTGLLKGKSLPGDIPQRDEPQAERTVCEMLTA